MNILLWITTIVEAILTIQLGYLLFLTLAALVAPRTTRLPQQPRSRFAIFVPAHNEERLLPELLSSLHQQDYPADLFDVYVVADNCSDTTAEVARHSNARVFERFNTSEIGKGYALNWLLRQVSSAPDHRPSDAYIIFDADTIVDKRFLRVMDARLQAGNNVIQGYYAVRDPGQSWGVAIRYAALAVLHYLRPLGRSIFGASAGLKGNGMCFRASLYEKTPWSGSVTEDIEYHMNLILSGERVVFAPDARLEAEMPGSLQSSSTQNVRWESGRLQAAVTYVPRLLMGLNPRQPWVALDAVMEHIIPPTALVLLGVGVSILAGGLASGLGAGLSYLALGVGLLAVLMIYILVGLAMVHAPGKVWLSFFYAPFYALWKIVLMVKILLGKRKQGWVRTQR